MECAKRAALVDSRFFALEAGKYCYSANSLQRATSLGTSKDCTAKMGSLAAGGSWSFNLYEMDEASKQKFRSTADKEKYAMATNTGDGTHTVNLR